MSLQIHGPGACLTAEDVSVHMNGGDGEDFAVLTFGPIEFYIDDPEQCDWLIRAAAEAKRLLDPPVITGSERTCPSIAEHSGRQCTRTDEHVRHVNGMITWGPGAEREPVQDRTPDLDPGELGGMSDAEFYDRTASAADDGQTYSDEPVAHARPRPTARCECGHLALHHHLNQVAGELQYCNECPGTGDCAAFSPARTASVTA